MKKILTKAELACLLEVKTTPEQAQIIIERNQAIIEMLNDRVNSDTQIGCPHCAESCVGCAYEVGSQFGVHSSWCLDYSFGGLTAQDINCVDLRSDGADVYARMESLSRREARLRRAEAKRWARGHIEWAREVIRRSRAKKPTTKK